MKQCSVPASRKLSTMEHPSSALVTQKIPGPMRGWKQCSLAASKTLSTVEPHGSAPVAHKMAPMSLAAAPKANKPGLSTAAKQCAAVATMERASANNRAPKGWQPDFAKLRACVLPLPQDPVERMTQLLLATKIEEIPPMAMQVLALKMSTRRQYASVLRCFSQRVGAQSILITAELYTYGIHPMFGVPRGPSIQY